ncbi:MAG: hypothetical protein VKI81_11175, partial [Synechococcaceae cyanobacterium]|nr:hypothetical protein [Synechococcaceae cyanobacterium]
LHGAGLGNADNRRLGESRGHEVWEGVRESLVSQRWDAQVVTSGRLRELTPPQTIADQIASVLEDAGGSDYARKVVEARNTWQAYRRDVGEHIAALSGQEFDRDWQELKEDLIGIFTGSPLPWGAAMVATSVVHTRIKDALREKQEMQKRVSSQLSLKEARFEEELEDLQKAYTEWLQFPLRASAKKKAAQAAAELIASFWEERTVQADVEHLSRLEARVAAIFVTATNQLVQVFAQWDPGLHQERDLYEKTEAVLEVLGDESVARGAFDRLRDAGDSESQVLVDEARHRLHRAVAGFLIDAVVPHVEKDHPISDDTVQMWRRRLRAELLQGIEDAFGFLVDKTIWEAVAQDAAGLGVNAEDHARALISRASGMAPSWLRLDAGALVEGRTGAPGAEEPHTFVIYDREAWRRFAKATGIVTGGQKIPGLESWAGIDVSVPNQDKLKHGLEPDVYQVSFLTVRVGMRVE